MCDTTSLNTKWNASAILRTYMTKGVVVVKRNQKIQWKFRSSGYICQQCHRNASKANTTVFSIIVQPGTLTERK